ncbi:MAG: hypothetical protein KF777_04170 [Planctomycetaceae bacterium]|nr:hypothetical protein [Planctomycetaceae bacterium]
MAKRRSSAGNPVTLFPFLAVLLCTMGSLIFLLLATTDRIRREQEMVARPGPAPASPLPESRESEQVPPQRVPTVIAEPIPLPPPPEEIVAKPSLPAGPTPEERAEREHQIAKLLQDWEGRVRELRQARDRDQRLVEQHRLLAESAAKDASELRGQLQQIDSQLDTSSSSLSDGPPASKSRADRKLIESQLEALRERLTTAAERNQQSSSQFSLVAFDPQSGTTRRPIIIECTDEAIIFQPENVRLTPEDLKGFTDTYNPILAGAVALIRHWQSQPTTPGEEPPEPYVLIVVRPSGTVAYYLAMQYLGTLRNAHGYELVDDSINLGYPTADPAAQTACREAVERALAHRSNVVATLRSAANGATPAAGNGGGNGGAGSGGGGGSAGTNNRFDLKSVGLDERGGRTGRSWEKIDRFENSPPSRQGSTASTSSPPVQWEQPSGSAGSASSERLRPPRPIPEGATVSNMPSPSSAPDVSVEEVPTQQSPRKPDDPSRFPRPTPLGPGLPRLPQNRPTITDRSLGLDEGQPSSSSAAAIPLENLRNRKWGNSPQNAIIGLEQGINVRVDAEKIIVGTDRILPVGQGESASDAFAAILSEVEAETRSWGAPPNGFFWRPSLNFHVSPGGNQHFERLQPLAVRSGLTTTRTFTLEPAAQTSGSLP